MRLKLVTAPTSEPVSLDEIKTHVRVDHDSDNADLRAKAISSRRWAERFQGRAYCTQVWDWYLDAFPSVRQIEVPLAPLASVTSITYSDSDDTSQTLSSSDYSVLAYDDSPGSVELNATSSWPTTYDKSDAVTIRFVAGYGNADDVPETIRQAILLHTRYAYDGGVAGDESDLTAAQRLLWQERLAIL